MQDTHLTTTEAGQRLGVSGKTVLRWAQAGKIAAVTLPSGHVRIPTDAVEQILTRVTAPEAAS